MVSDASKQHNAFISNGQKNILNAKNESTRFLQNAVNQSYDTVSHATEPKFSCTMPGFATSGVETLCSTATEFIN